MPETKFKVGDYVVSKAQAEVRRLWPDSYHRAPLLMHVVEIQVNTCYAGTQVVYVVRHAGTDGIAGQLANVTEIEVEAAPAEPAEPETDELAEAHAENAALRRKLREYQQARAESPKPEGDGG